MVNVQQSVLIHFVARDEVSGTVGLMSGALTTFGIAAIKMAADFDLAFAKVSSLLPQTKSQLKFLEEGVLSLSKRLGVDAVQSMEALYEAISSGIPKESALNFLEVSSKAAIAGVTDTTTAVDGMTSAMNAFKIPMSDANKVADQMFQSVNIGKFTFEELAASMGVASSIAHVTGISLNEMLAAAATITKEGVTVSVAMTRVRSAITALNKPSETLKGIFEQLGVATGLELVQKFGGLQGALEAIRTTADATGIQLPKVFGRIEATLGTLALTGEKAADARDDLASVTETTNAMGQAFAKIDATPVRNWSRLVTEFKDGMIDAANSSLPAVNGIINVFREMVGVLNGMPDAVKSTGVELGTLFGTIGLGLAVGIKFATVLGSISQALFVSTAAAKASGIVWMQFGSMAATGLGAIVIWAAAAAAAIVALDIAMKALTPSGKGIFDRMFGPSSRAENLKKDLDEIMSKLSAIDELYNPGSQANTNRKDEILNVKIKALEEAIIRAKDLRAEYDKLSDAQLGGEQTIELKLPTQIKDAINDAEDLGKQLTKAYEEGNISQDLFLKGMGKIHDALLLNGKDGLKAWENLVGTDAGQRYIDLTAEMAKIDEEGFLSRGKIAKANKELGSSYQGLEIDIEGVSDTLADSIDAFQGSARAIQDAIGAMEDLGDAIKSMNPEYQKNNALIAMNELALAKLKNSARDAAGNLRPLTDAEQLMADTIKGNIDSLQNKNEVLDKTEDVIISLTAAVAASIAPFEKAGTLAEEDAAKFTKWASELLNAQGVTDTTVQAVQLLGGTFQNFVKDPAAAIASLVALREKLGKDSPEWSKLANSFTSDFWKQLIGDLGDPTMASGVAQILGQVLGIDLSDLGYAVAKTYTGAIKRGLAGGDIDDNPINDVVRTLQDRINQTTSMFATAGKESTDAYIAGISSGKDKVKTAAEGFISTFEDTMRASALNAEFGDLGGELVDKLTVAIRDNTESAGSAVGSSLTKILDKMKEVRPGPEAEAWGTALTEAVRYAIESGAPSAIAAVANMLNAIKGVISSHDLAITQINTIGAAITNALKNKYGAEKKAAMDAADAKIAAANKARDAEMKAASKSHEAAMRGFQASSAAASKSYADQSKSAQKAYDAQTRSMDEAHKRQIDNLNEETKIKSDAINAQIDDLNRYLELEDRANDAIDHTDKMGNLQNEYGRAKSAAERARIQKKIDKEVRDNQKNIHRDTVQDTISNLKKELDAIKENADERKDIIDNLFDKQKQAAEDAHQAMMDSLNAQQQAASEAASAAQQSMNDSYQAMTESRDLYWDETLKDLEEEKEEKEKHYDKLLDDAAIYAEALAILQRGNQEEIIALLKKYNPEWQNAGQSLGEALVDGVKSGMKDMATQIAEIFALAFSAIQLPAFPGMPTGMVSGQSGGSSLPPGFSVKPDVDRSVQGRFTGAYAGGSPYTREGLSFVGEMGVELANFSSGSSISSHSQTKEMIKQSVIEALGSGGDDARIINVYIGQDKLDTIITKSLTRSSRNTY